MEDSNIPPRTPDIRRVPDPPVPNRAETEMRAPGRTEIGTPAPAELEFPSRTEIDIPDVPHAPMQVGNFKPGDLTRKGDDIPLGNFEAARQIPHNGMEN